MSPNPNAFTIIFFPLMLLTLLLFLCWQWWFRPWCDSDKSSIWPSWSSVWGKASCMSTEPSLAVALLTGICACCVYRSVKTWANFRGQHREPLRYIIFEVALLKSLSSHGGFAGGSEGECIPEGAVRRAHRLHCPGKGGGGAPAGCCWSRDAATNWKPERGLWEARRGNEETGRQGLCLPNIKCCKQSLNNNFRFCFASNFCGLCWLRTAFRFIYIVQVSNEEKLVQWLQIVDFIEPKLCKGSSKHCYGPNTNRSCMCVIPVKKFTFSLCSRQMKESGIADRKSVV